MSGSVIHASPLADLDSRDDLVCQLELRCTLAEAALEDARRHERLLEANVHRFRELYRNSPVAFLTIDQNSRIVEMNPAACRLLDMSARAAIGLHFGALLADKAAVRFLEQLRRARSATTEPVKVELDLISGKHQRVSVEAVTSKFFAGAAMFFEMALIDLTAQKIATAVELNAREHAERIVATLPFPILTLDHQARVLSANSAFYRFFQTTERQVINYHISELPEIDWQTKQIDRVLLEAMKEGRSLDDVVVRATLWRGSLVTLQMSARRFITQNSGRPCMLVAFEDTTRRKRAEEEREVAMRELEEAGARLEVRVEERTQELEKSYGRLREVGEQLILAHESEQRRIARELHDQIGQDLTALKIMLSRGKIANAGEAHKTLQEAAALTEELLQTVRNICGTLRPQVLDDLGLVAGLQWHIKTFAERTGLEIHFDLGPVDENRLSPIIQSTIFRVIQEALTNVSRHAGTKNASVALSMHDGAVEFSVADDGRGFEMSEVGKKASTGISSMRERLSLVQGQFEIRSSPGNGVLIKARIPIRIQDPTNPRPNNSEVNRNHYGKGSSNQNYIS